MKIIIAFLLLAGSQTFARDKDRDFRHGAGGNRGNENSQRPGGVVAGQPSHGGNGCPQGTMSVTFAPDNLSFTVIFNQFVAQIDQKSAHDAMSCDALIPMQIPAGMQMEITRVDFRGFAGLPDKAKGTLHSVFNFRGKQGDRDRINLRYQFRGPLMDNYLISSDSMPVEQTEVSPCGGPANLRIATDLKLTSPGKEQATLTLDSVDASSHATYYVNWRQCK